MTHGPAYHEGKQAGEASKNFEGLLRNPYPSNTKEHDDWTLGWCFAWAHKKD